MEEKELRTARVAALFSVARPAYPGGAAIAAMLVVVLWEFFPHALLLAWLATMLAVMLGRVAIHFAFVRAPEPRDGVLWERRFVLGALVSGAVWAYVPIVLIPHAYELIEAAVVIIVGGILVAGAGLTAASLRAVYALVLLPLAAATVQLVAQPDSVHRLLGVSVVLFGVVMARMAHDIHRSMVSALAEKLRNQSLRERVEGSEMRLRAAIESFPDGIAVWNAEDRLAACNETYARLYGAGLGAAQLAGTPFARAAAAAWETENLPGRADASARSHWIEQRVLRHREGSGAANQFQGRDGRWYMGRTVRTRDGGWVGLVTDVTELKSAQAAFEAVLAEEDLVLDTLPVGVAFLENRTVSRCNRRLEEMLGYAEGELQGKSTLAWFGNAERWSAAGQNAYRGMHGGAIMGGDARLVRKDGSRFWCRVIGRPLDPQAPDQAAIFAFSDINQRVHAEQALKESEEKLRLAVESADIVYWDWDRDSGEVAWGDGHVRKWEHYRDQVHPEDRDRYVAAVNAAWEKGEPYSCEYRVMGRGGKAAWISARGKTMSDPAGRRSRMIGVAQDVTERRAQEEAVRFLADHDSLTGLPNRRLLDDRLKQAVFQAQRRGVKVAAMLVDLDDFKQVNDSAGHRAGDAVLREVAARLGGCVRKADTLARHGGDEFVIVIADAQTEADGSIVAEKILRAFEPPFVADGREFILGASIGISIFPGDAADADALLRNADAAMYRAKELGRNRYRFHGG